jgi:hypothetical protein
LEYKQENQLRRELTLEDVAPLWAARLGNERTFPTFMSSTWFKWCRELRWTSRCVVGEAYGYSSKYVYTCDECNDFGCKFMYYFTMNWHGMLERNKQRFLKHWNGKNRRIVHPAPNRCISQTLALKRSDNLLCYS